MWKNQPVPESIVQKVNRSVAHWSFGLSDQPVFVLTETKTTRVFMLRILKGSVMGEKSRVESHLPVDVEVGVSGSFGAVEGVLVLRGRCPWGVGRWRGHHH